MKYLLNMPETERRMKQQGIKSMSQLLRESKLIPNSFFSNQTKHSNEPVVSLNTLYMISRRLKCSMEDILIVRK